MHQQHIERYTAGAPVLSHAIDGLTPDQLTARPGPGKWSIHELVLHMMDSDLIGADRMKRIIAEDKPTLLGYDQDRYNERLHYHDMDIRAAAKIFELNRLMTGDLLRRLPDEAFKRIGNHNEVGSKSLADFVKGYADHLDHHMKFLREKRAILGVPLA
ncbi:MAG: DinB family protein [Planctomycetota bacterium]|nr:DinB family protein [Planctomycetota bacterium]